LDRVEAVSVLREIISKCNLIVNFVNLVPPRADDVVSKGYQIHIKPSIDTCDREVVLRIIVEHQLALQEDDEKIIIYKPKP
jgi:hypothetical protein